MGAGGGRGSEAAGPVAGRNPVPRTATWAGWRNTAHIQTSRLRNRGTSHLEPGYVGI
jgi:hypothetical protein